MSPALCAKCGGEVRESDRFCPVCGSTVAKQCSLCLSDAPIAATFCPHCGQDLAKYAGGFPLAVADRWQSFFRDLGWNHHDKPHPEEFPPYFKVLGMKSPGRDMDQGIPISVWEWIGSQLPLPGDDVNEPWLFCNKTSTKLRYRTMVYLVGEGKPVAIQVGYIVATRSRLAVFGLQDVYGRTISELGAGDPCVYRYSDLRRVETIDRGWDPGEYPSAGFRSELMTEEPHSRGLRIYWSLPKGPSALEAIFSYGLAQGGHPVESYMREQVVLASYQEKYRQAKNHSDAVKLFFEQVRDL